MADPVRYTIIEQLKAALEAITVAGGYRNDVATVAVKAIGWNDTEIKDSTNLPLIAIIPQTETIRDQPFGDIESDWAFDIIAHFDVASSSGDQDLDAALACEGISNDIRKALFIDPKLGIDEVVTLTIRTRAGTEGAPEAAQRAKGSVHFQIVVKFIERTSDD